MASLLSGVISSFRRRAAETEAVAEQPADTGDEAAGEPASSTVPEPALSAPVSSAPAPARVAEVVTEPPLLSVQEVQRRILSDSGRVSPLTNSVIDRYIPPSFTQTVMYSSVPAVVQSPLVLAVSEPHADDPVRIREVRIGRASPISPTLFSEAPAGGAPPLRVAVSPSWPTAPNGQFASLPGLGQRTSSGTNFVSSPTVTTLVGGSLGHTGYRRVGNEYVYDDSPSATTVERRVYSSQVLRPEVHAIEHVTKTTTSPSTTLGGSPTLRLGTISPVTVVGSYLPLQPVGVPADDGGRMFSSKYIPLGTQDSLVIPTEPLVMRHSSYASYNRYCANKATENAL